MNNKVKNSYPNGECPDCGETIPFDVAEGEECGNCGHVYVSPSECED
jgi:ribosomal protein S27E